jgi:hypothetical protein
LRSTLSLVIGAMLLTVGCADTPLSPTAVGAGPATGGSPNLRWDLKAAGCSPPPAPSPTPDSTVARVRLEADGALVANWSIVSTDNRPMTLYARFLSAGRDWALCTWDTVDQ